MGGFAGHFLCKALTGLGVTETAKRGATCIITEAAEKATRWLWIKRASPQPTKMCGFPLVCQQRLLYYRENLKAMSSTHISTNWNSRWIILLVNIDQSQFVMVNIYASNNWQNNVLTFSTIESKIYQLLVVFPLAKVLWGGDFNTVMDKSMDRWPTKNRVSELGNICCRMDLIDIGRHKHLNQKV